MSTQSWNRRYLVFLTKCSRKGADKLETLVAAGVAGTLTLFDIDKTFYFPSSNPQRVKLAAWILGFVLTNALLSVATYLVVRDVQPFSDWNPWLAALAAGTGYLAIIHAKLATFNFQGHDIPFGVELLYQGGKDYAFKRINRIAKLARRKETVALAQEKDLKQLAREARLSITQDGLMTPADKDRWKAWILEILKDADSDDMDKCLYLADFILSN